MTKAEDVLRDAISCELGQYKALIDRSEYEGTFDDDVELTAYALAQALRDAGLLLEWRTDIENAPKGKTVAAYRPDAGWFSAMFGSMEYLNIPEREAEEIPEDEFFADQWWAFTEDGLVLLQGDERPTHFAIIQPPEASNEG